MSKEPKVYIVEVRDRRTGKSTIKTFDTRRDAREQIRKAEAFCQQEAYKIRMWRM